ncbi:hypothetical protein E2542_SST20565 [Spatholobus suberectus]|nr:hypothetical protein E2542_SST20565 [Spatholobus suberectus]
MENCSTSKATRVTMWTSNRNNLCFCEVPCKIQSLRTFRNPSRKFFGCGRYDAYTKYCHYFSWCDPAVDEVYDKEELIALVASVMYDFGDLQQRLERMNDELRTLSSMVEMVNNQMMELSIGNWRLWFNHIDYVYVRVVWIVCL